MKYRLQNVDVSGVDFVGAPANHRPFALFKSIGGRKAEEPETMKLTLAEFKKRVATEVDGDIADDQLTKLAKAIGIEIVKEAPSPKIETKKTTDGGDAGADEPEKTPSGADAIAKAVEAAVNRVTKAFEEKIGGLEKAQAAREKAELTKRVRVLKAAGYELEDEVTEPEIAALEKAHERLLKVADRVGLTKAFGTAEADEPTTGISALHKAIDRQVVEVLGRAPISALEKAVTKREIYRANPGMLTAVVKAERAQRQLAAAG